MKLFAPILAGALAVGTLTTMSSPAQASFPTTSTTGYICQHYLYRWNSGYYGDWGGIYVNLYTQPGCAGSYLGYGYIFSLNATAGFAYDMMDAQDPAILAAEHLAIQQASLAGQEVTVYTYTGYDTAIGRIRYHAM